MNRIATLIILIAPVVLLAAPQLVDNRKPYQKLIPADAKYVFTIRLAEVWKNPAIDLIKGMFKSFETSNEEMPFGSRIQDIERLTIVGIDDFRSQITLVSSIVPFDIKKLRKGDTTEPVIKQIRGRTVWRYEDSWTSLCLLDEHTAIGGPSDLVEWVLSKDLARLGPMETAIREMEEYTIFFACQGTGGPDVERALTAKESLKPLVDLLNNAQRLQLGISLDEEPKLIVKALVNQPENAKKLSDAFAKWREVTIESVEMILAGVNIPQVVEEKPMEPIKDEDQAQVTMMRDVFTVYHAELKKREPTMDQQGFQFSMALPKKNAISGLVFCMFTTHISEGLIASEEPKEQKIAEAILRYEAVHGHLPPLATFDKDGKPLLSWRVLILPYLGEEESKLFKEFKLDQVWDGPDNIKLVRRMPKIFNRGSDSNGGLDRATTNFQVFTGPGTLFHGQSGFNIRNVKNQNRIPLIAIANQRVPWTKPSDLSIVAGKPVPDLKPSEAVEKTQNWLTRVAFLDGKSGTIPSNMTFPDSQEKRDENGQAKNMKDENGNPKPIRNLQANEQVIREAILLKLGQ